MTDTPKICLIHVAKTGGTYVKKAIRETLGVPPRRDPYIVNGNLVLLGHKSLEETAQSYGADRKFGFVFRDPTTRFVSGFYCRLRMGRPDHNVVWNVGEAGAFSFFHHANDLAEALYCDDNRLMSAAHFAMKQIRHLVRNYEFHFGPMISFTLGELPNLVSCINITNMQRDLPRFLGQMGLPNAVMPARSDGSQDATHPRGLSPLGTANLRRFWAEEYAYYDLFQELEQAFAKG